MNDALKAVRDWFFASRVSEPKDDDLVVLSVFPEGEHARAMREHLIDNGVQAMVSPDTVVDPILFTGYLNADGFRVMVLGKDLERARRLTEESLE